MNKVVSPSGEVHISLPKKGFVYLLIGFSLLFLIYVIVVGYYNNLALDDFGYLWVRRNYGFLNPYTYWYLQWQGRVGPHLLKNAIFSIYDLTNNLVFYSIFLGTLFIYCINEILKYYFSATRLMLFSYSILLFSALFLTTFELSTFYWIHASPNYFAAIAFGLLGVVFILKGKPGILNSIFIALCFLYVGSSSEHVGALVCCILFFVLIYIFFSSAYNFADFNSHVRNFISGNKGLLIALVFCLVAFIAMIFAPGTKVRMSATQQTIAPVHLMQICYDSTKFIGRHFFYKLPYFLLYIPLFLLFGSHFKTSKVTCSINFIYVLLFAAVVTVAFIFLSNLPIAYATSSVGPLRSYVYVNFFLVVILFLVCLYAASYYRLRIENIQIFSIIAVVLLSGFVLYTSYYEFPLLHKYKTSQMERLELLSRYQKSGRKHPVFISPCFKPEYVTITDRWRTLTRTDKLSSSMSGMPIIIEEIGQPPDWRNEQLKVGLNLGFDIYLTPQHQE
jgi:hypothetical protein